MNWLVVTQDFPPGFIGGIAAWASDVADALHRAGHDVTVLARQTPGTRGADGRQPYRIVRMIGRSWNRFQGTWANLHARRFLAPDVSVLTATWSLATQLVDPVERRGSRLFVAFHGSDLTREITAPDGLVDVAKRAHGLLPVSRFLASELARLVPETKDDPRVRILPMPLRVPAAPPTGTRGGLLSVARLNELKGVDRCIRLADRIGIRIAVVGDGPARDSLPDGPHVRWLGRRTRAELVELYASARAVVLLPRTTDDGLGAEGLGLCLLEGAAQGAITIGAPTGGVPEAVGPGVLVDDPDWPDIDVVREALADPALPARCHRFVREHHGPERAVAVLQSL